MKLNRQSKLEQFDKSYNSKTSEPFWDAFSNKYAIGNSNKRFFLQATLLLAMPAWNWQKIRQMLSNTFTCYHPKITVNILIKISERKSVSQSVIYNFRATSGIFKKGHFWRSFTQKYLKIILFLEKRAFFVKHDKGQRPTTGRWFLLDYSWPIFTRLYN